MYLNVMYLCALFVSLYRNDRQKYVNSEKKTVSMKNERVGVKGKNNIDQKSGTLRTCN